MFSDEFKIVNKECLLISNCFANGLTCLRKANLNNKGLFYTVFFQLSIGIERLCKLALSVNNYAINGSFLTLQEMKKIGHNISELLSQVQTKIPNGMIKINDSEVSKEIIDLLNDFAKSTRYYNLDVLSGGVNLGKEPVDEWLDRVVSIAYRDIIKPNVRLRNSLEKSGNLITEIYQSFEDTKQILFVNIDGDDLIDNVKKTNTISKIAPYLIIEIADIVKPIVEYMSNIINERKLNLPNVREYFYYNILLENESLRRIKKFKVSFND